MHSTETKTIIGTQESVYRDSPAGKLEKSSLVGNMLVPHQQGFNSDSKARFSIAVDYLPTLTREQGIVATVLTFSHSTAVAAPYTLPGEVKTLSGEYRKSDGDGWCGSSPRYRMGYLPHGW